MLPKKSPAAAAKVLEFTSSPNKLPPVEQVRGVTLQRSALESERKVFVEYTDRTNDWHELEMPLRDAMYLLGLLRQIERESGLDSLNEPLPDE